MANRYLNSKILKTELGKRYYSTLMYPEIPLSDEDEYVITTVGDRLDLIALEKYGDPEFWYILFFANYNSGLRRDSLNVLPGIQLRIPADISAINNELNRLNNSR